MNREIIVTESRLPFYFSGPYEGCYAGPYSINAIDPRHVYLLHDLLMAHPYRHALEIGSWCGASATAFIEAINRGSKMLATFADPVLQPSLECVVASCKFPGRAKCIESVAVGALSRPETFDFIFHDAKHDLPSLVTEIAMLVLRSPLSIAVHDTSANENGLKFCEGAAVLKAMFANTAGYTWFEDKARREGEMTHRGLFFATRDKGIANTAKLVFEKWA